MHENEKDIYGDVPECVLDIVESVGSQALRLAWDPANYVQVGVTPFSQGYTALRPYMDYVQIKDAVLATGDVVPAGEGDGQVRETVRALARRRLRRLCSMEPHLGTLQRVRRALRSRELHARHPRVHRHSRQRRDRVPMSTPKIRFALVGAGVIGTVHAEALSQLPDVAELVAVVDRDPARARELATRYGAAVATADLDAVLRRDDVDAVTICTPSGCARRREPYAALEGGQARRRREADRHHARRGRPDHRRGENAPGRPVAVVSQHRFDRSTEKVLDAVRDGHLGTVTSAIASHAWWRGQSYYDSGEWRGTWSLDGGGAVMNQTVHTINLMITTVGVPVGGLRLHRMASPTSASRSRTPQSRW